MLLTSLIGMSIALCLSLPLLKTEITVAPLPEVGSICSTLNSTLQMPSAVVHVFSSCYVGVSVSDATDENPGPRGVSSHVGSDYR